MTQVSRVPCPQCGESVEVGTTFCPNCGFYLDWSRPDEEDASTDADMMRRPEETVESAPPPPPPPPPADTTLEIPPQVTCPNCGEGNEQSRTFCRRCGAALQGQAPPPPPPPPSPEPRPWWPYAVGAVALLVIAGIFLATRGGDGDEPGPTAAPTTVPATAGPTQPTTPPTTEPPVTESPPVTTAARIVALDGDAVATRAGTPKTIDARDDDWDAGVIHTTPHVIFVQRLVRDGAVARAGSQNTAEVRLAWDDEHLYLFAVVEDDVHSQPNVGNQVWHGDAVDINIAAGGPGSGASLRPNDDDFQVTLSPGDPVAGTPVESVVFIGAGQSFGPDEVGIATVAAVVDGGGYTLEAQIPWSVIGVDAPSAGQRLGFLLSIFDNDGEVGEFLTGREGALQTEIVANTPGAGFQDPQTWGTLTLEG